MAKINLDIEHDLPEGSTPLEMVVVVKVLDKDGDVAMCVRTTGGLTEWECIGMLTAANDASRGHLDRAFQQLDEGDDQ